MEAIGAGGCRQPEITDHEPLGGPIVPGVYLVIWSLDDQSIDSRFSFPQHLANRNGSRIPLIARTLDRKVARPQLLAHLIAQLRCFIAVDAAEHATLIDLLHQIAVGYP